MKYTIWQLLISYHLNWNIMLKIVLNKAAVSNAKNFKNNNFSPMSTGFTAEP